MTATENPQPLSEPGPAAADLRRKLLLAGQIALVAALLALAFHEFFAWLLDNWQHDEYYSHGPLIPLISAYLIYRQWPKLKTLPVEGHNAWGLALVAGGLLFHIASVYSNVRFPSGFGLIAVLYGLVIWFWGWPRARALLFPFVFLFFMVPMARLLVDKFSVPMQLFSARGAAALGSVFGIVERIEGVKIFTRDYVFEVAIPCSGLKSIIAMSALGALVAWVLEGAPWKRWILFAASVPIAVIANILRIFVTLVLGNSIGPAAAEGFFHEASGALVFVIAFVGLLVLGGAMGCRQMREDI